MGKGRRVYKLVRDDESDIDQDIDISHNTSFSISRDGRRKKVCVGSPLKRTTRQPAPPKWSSDSGSEGDEREAGEEEEGQKLPRKRYQSSDAPMLEWSGGLESAGYRDQYLDEMLRLDGRGSSIGVDGCQSCVSGGEEEVGTAVYRCVDCLCDTLECKECIVRAHERNPLHMIERWTGDFFVRVPLRELGLRVQLGHAGRECQARRPGPVDFTVIHTNGIHKVAVDFCDCSQRVQHRQQLLRFRWFPATVHQPQTCATFAMLNTFHALKHAGKLSTWEHYVATIHLTDNTGVTIPKSRYQPYLWMNRQWQHLRMMKRGGRGHAEGGIIGTQPGELAMPCLACPMPGVNLPENWKEAPWHRQFIYRPIMSVDANFRLKNLFRSDEKSDPGLHTGLAYFVEQKGYKRHLRKHITQTDISTCSGFQTLAHAETKDSTGLRSTGVVMCICARHETVSGLGVGDLQKGERYCNVDYVTLSGCTRFHELDEIFFSYDIACQWCKNLPKRMKKLRRRLRLPAKMRICFGIPKCHCPGHLLECQCQMSMNVQPGAVQTDGEGIKRTWSRMNACASCTKVMGPGSRHDTIDDLLGSHNWHKRCCLGVLLARRAREAAREYAIQSTAHLELTQALPDLSVVQVWTAEVEAWERDRSKPNPYLITFKHVSEAEVKLAVVNEEDEEGASGVPQLDDTSASGCLTLAFFIEDAQRRVRHQQKAAIKSATTTTAKALDLSNKRRRIVRQVKQFRIVQASYMPCVSRLRSMQAQEHVAAEDLELWLPSQLDPRMRKRGCLGGIAEKERRFREAQCADALDTIRASLRTSNALQLNRGSKPVGQKYATRAHTTLARQKSRCELAVAKYRHAREALRNLDPDGDWQARFQELRSADLTHFGATFDVNDELSKAEKMAGKKQKGKKKNKRHEVLVRPGDGKKTTSWIWRVEGALGNGEDAEMNQAARLEWLKSRARMCRWGEEVTLVEEEQRRVSAGLDHLATEWKNRISGRVGIDPAMTEGLRAYAMKQAEYVCRRMANHFTDLWTGKTNLPVEEEGEFEGVYVSGLAETPGVREELDEATPPEELAMTEDFEAEVEGEDDDDAALPVAEPNLASAVLEDI